jgi:hypothetical protein
MGDNVRTPGLPGETVIFPREQVTIKTETDFHKL